MDFLFLGIIVLMFYGVEFSGTKFFDPTNQKTNKSLRGILAIAIVLFHLSQRTSDGLFYHTVMGDSGHLTVSVFFFISGYGLLSQLKNRGGGEYLEDFIKRRFTSILLPWIIASIMYIAYYVSFDRSTLIEAIGNRQNCFLVIQNSWYMGAILVFYFLFWVSYKAFGTNKRILPILVVLFGICCYIALAFACGLGRWWYYSSLAFVLGLLWKEYENTIIPIEHKWYYFLLIISILLFSILYYLRNTVGIGLVSYFVQSFVFPIIIVLVLSKIKLSNKILDFCGGISVEIYLLHELSYTVLRSSYVYIENDIVFVLFTFGLTLFFATALHQLENFYAKKNADL